MEKDEALKKRDYKTFYSQIREVEHQMGNDKRKKIYQDSERKIKEIKLEAEKRISEEVSKYLHQNGLLFENRMMSFEDGFKVYLNVRFSHDYNEYWLSWELGLSSFGRYGDSGCEITKGSKNIEQIKKNIEERHKQFLFRKESDEIDEKNFENFYNLVKQDITKSNYYGETELKSLKHINKIPREYLIDSGRGFNHFDYAGLEVSCYDRKFHFIFGSFRLSFDTLGETKKIWDELKELLDKQPKLKFSEERN